MGTPRKKLLRLETSLHGCSVSARDCWGWSPGQALLQISLYHCHRCTVPHCWDFYWNLHPVLAGQHQANPTELEHSLAVAQESLGGPWSLVVRTCSKRGIFESRQRGQQTDARTEKPAKVWVFSWSITNLSPLHWIWDITNHPNQGYLLIIVMQSFMSSSLTWILTNIHWPISFTIGDRAVNDLWATTYQPLCWYL